MSPSKPLFQESWWWSGSSSGGKLWRAHLKKTQISPPKNWSISKIPWETLQTRYTLVVTVDGRSGNVLTTTTPQRTQFNQIAS